MYSIVELTLPRATLQKSLALKNFCKKKNLFPQLSILENISIFMYMGVSSWLVWDINH